MATVTVPVPVAEAVTLPGVPAPLPPVEATAVPSGSVLVAVSLLVTVAALCVTKNGKDDEFPPPGIGLKTLTSNVPGEISNAVGTTADSSDEDT